MDFIGGITFFGGSFAPRDWATCHGQIMPISQNQALFAILGTIWGGDGRTSFALPDMRGRSTMGAGQGPGLSTIARGQQRGVEYIYLTESNLPVHDHVANFIPTGVSGGSALTATVTVNAYDGTGDKDSPTDNFWATTKSGLGTTPTYAGTANTVMADGAVEVTLHGSAGGITGGTVNIQSTGADQPFPIWSPSLAIDHIIMIQGVFPARN